MRVGIIGNSTKNSLREAITALLTFQKKYQLEYFYHRELFNVLKKKFKLNISNEKFIASGSLVQHSDVIIAFGGDGTILTAARIVGNSNIPILGINLGQLGFLAESSQEELESFMEAFVKGNHVVEERSVLQIIQNKDTSNLFALNDVVVDKSSSSRVIYISVYVNNEFLVNYAGDGIVIATPTGSTGYALAAGGPIITPATNVFTIQSISAHSLNVRTVVVPDSSEIQVSVEKQSEMARVTIDGQEERVCMPGKSIQIKKADHTIKLIKRRGKNYYDVLRAKLLWGSDIRQERRETR